MSGAQPKDIQDKIAAYRRQNGSDTLTAAQERRVRSSENTLAAREQARAAALPQSQPIGDVTSASEWRAQRASQNVPAQIMIVNPESMDLFVTELTAGRIINGTYDFTLQATDRFELSRESDRIRSKLSRLCRQRLITYSTQRVVVEGANYLRLVLEGLHCE